MSGSLIERLREAARARLDGAEPAHDWSHVARVVVTARRLAAIEHADVDVVEAAATLHEWVQIPKGHPDAAFAAERCAEAVLSLLTDLGAPAPFSDHVAACIRTHSFSRGLPPGSLEAKILQDADRMDAIGAIGIARCMATTATMGRPFYAPEDPFCTNRTPDDKAWGIDHFYRKLLGLADAMHTTAARAMAAERTRHMELFLAQLGDEIGHGTGDVLRDVRDSDAEDLIGLIGACFAEYPGCVQDVNGELPELHAPATAFAALQGRLWVVERAGRVIASGGFSPSREPGGIEIRKLYVSRRHRGRGLASRLMTRIEAEGAARGASFADLWTDTRFTTAHAFYAARGYARGPVTRFLHDLSATEEFYYRKALIDAAGR